MINVAFSLTPLCVHSGLRVRSNAVEGRRGHSNDMNNLQWHLHAEMGQCQKSSIDKFQ